LSIRIFYDEIDFKFTGWRKTVKIIREVIGKEEKFSGDLNFIITNDKLLRDINVKFLEHDYNTDVIAFDYSKENVISGDIYISLETVKANAVNYNVSLRTELLRVMIHGLLHLLGYDDKTKTDRAIMKGMEDLWLKEIE
jgi:probable rRNA maturation factor